MKYYFLYTQKSSAVLWMGLLFSFIFSACYQEMPTEAPQQSDAKMRAVLKDIHLAEALLTEIVDRGTKDSMASIYYYQILAQHELSPEAFEESMNAYFTDPIALDSLYTHIIKDLSEERDSLKNVKREEQQKN